MTNSFFNNKERIRKNGLKQEHTQTAFFVDSPLLSGLIIKYRHSVDKLNVYKYI